MNINELQNDREIIRLRTENGQLLRRNEFLRRQNKAWAQHSLQQLALAEEWKRLAVKFEKKYYCYD